MAEDPYCRGRPPISRKSRGFRASTQLAANHPLKICFGGTSRLERCDPTTFAFGATSWLQQGRRCRRCKAQSLCYTERMEEMDERWKGERSFGRKKLTRVARSWEHKIEEGTEAPGPGLRRACPFSSRPSKTHSAPLVPQASAAILRDTRFDDLPSDHSKPAVMCQPGQFRISHRDSPPSPLLA